MQKATRSRSYLPKSILITALGLITSIGYNAAAVDVVTDPVGFITLTAVGNGGSGSKYSFVGLGMTQVPAVQAGITSVSGKQINVGNTLTAGQFTPVVGGPNPAYFIEFLDGSAVGLLDDITSNNTTAIFTAFDDSPFVGTPTKYKVYPHWTIGTVFGPQNQAGLLGGSAVGPADNILVWNPATQGSVTYFFKTTGLGGTGWRSTASTSINTSNTVLYIDQGVEVLRKTTGDVPIKLVGGVKLGSTISPIVGNGGSGSKYTFAGNVYPAGITLGSSTLYTGNNTTGLNGGSAVGPADNVLIWNPATQGSVTYFFKTTGLGGTGWRSTASTSIDASTNTIPLGGFATIQRKINGDFNWHMPQPFVQ